MVGMNKMLCEICEQQPATYSFDSNPDEESFEIVTVLVCVECGNLLIKASEPDYWSFEKLERR
jgi:protein-arginine kinase activator protein McsA